MISCKALTKRHEEKTHPDYDDFCCNATSGRAESWRQEHPVGDALAAYTGRENLGFKACLAYKLSPTLALFCTLNRTINAPSAPARSWRAAPCERHRPVSIRTRKSAWSSPACDSSATRLPEAAGGLQALHRLRGSIEMHQQLRQGLTHKTSVRPVETLMLGSICPPYLTSIKQGAVPDLGRA